MTDSETVHARPLPRRPDNGLLAWQATLGYISARYSLDAMLTVQVHPLGEGILGWTAKASWGKYTGEVQDCQSLPACLRDLWAEVERNNIIFESPEAISRRPVLYDDDEWLDAETQLTLDRLVQLNWTAFNKDWMLLIVYQPVELPGARTQARLLARANGVQISGRGATIRAACHDLYRNAARSYSTYTGKPFDPDF